MAQPIGPASWCIFKSAELAVLLRTHGAVANGRSGQSNCTRCFRMNKPRRWTLVLGIVALLLGARRSTSRSWCMLLGRRAQRMGRLSPQNGALAHAPMASGVA